ncbi:MAG: methyltransferase domain-containing protein, partial [Bacteroidia bacterium]|nr:methyltransferase domain-containing protein [Bacteroidia bacterium]
MARNKTFKLNEFKEFPNTFENPPEIKGNWGKSFFKNNNPIVLELGCGKGEYTLGLAELFPDKNFIGIDVKGARLWKGAKTAIENEI